MKNIQIEFDEVIVEFDRYKFYWLENTLKEYRDKTIDKVILYGLEPFLAVCFCLGQIENKTVVLHSDSNDLFKYNKLSMNLSSYIIFAKSMTFPFNKNYLKIKYTHRDGTFEFEVS